tara:strand:+ start:88 stop:609 length:522 start_codon:yes stop_codon:yes gene_type:complete
MRSGCFLWVTGLSGSGKTAVANQVAETLRDRGRSVILLNGDELREILDVKESFERDQRERLAFIYARLGHSHAKQGIDVVCATISMFQTVRDWNRDNISKYLEIYLRVPFDIRAARDSKGLYFNERNSSNMVEFSNDFQEPETPDLVIDNYGGTTVGMAVQAIIKKLDETIID